MGASLSAPEPSHPGPGLTLGLNQGAPGVAYRPRFLTSNPVSPPTHKGAHHAWHSCSVDRNPGHRGQATNTVYVTNTGPFMNGNGDTVSVINGATCNAGNTSGCGQKPTAVKVGKFPFFLAFDATNQTVYVTDALSNAPVSSNADGVVTARGASRESPAGVYRSAAVTPWAGLKSTGGLETSNSAKRERPQGPPARRRRRPRRPPAC